VRALHPFSPVFSANSSEFPPAVNENKVGVLRLPLLFSFLEEDQCDQRPPLIQKSRPCLFSPPFPFQKMTSRTADRNQHRPFFPSSSLISKISWQKDCPFFSLFPPSSFPPSQTEHPGLPLGADAERQISAPTLLQASSLRREEKRRNAFGRSREADLSYVAAGERLAESFFLYLFFLTGKRRE